MLSLLMIRWCCFIWQQWWIWWWWWWCSCSLFMLTTTSTNSLTECMWPVASTKSSGLSCCSISHIPQMLVNVINMLKISWSMTSSTLPPSHHHPEQDHGYVCSTSWCPRWWLSHLSLPLSELSYCYYCHNFFPFSFVTVRVILLHLLQSFPLLSPST